MGETGDGFALEDRLSGPECAGAFPPARNIDIEDWF